MHNQTIPLKIMNGPVVIPGQATTIPKFWNIVDVSDKEAEIVLYGEIISKRRIDWWTGEPIDELSISPEGFLEDLAKVKDKAQITVRINSVGGDLMTAITISHRLKELKGETIAVIDGLAASAATIIAMGCKKREIPEGALFMVHDALAFLYGNYNKSNLAEVDKMLETIGKAMAEIYDSATGIGIDNIRSIMAEETWYTGREAVEVGFCTAIREGFETSISMSAKKDALIVNGVSHSIKGFRNIPKGISIINSIQTPEQTPTVNAPGDLIKNQKGDEKDMTSEELKQQYPDVVAMIEKIAMETARVEASAAERTRLQEIEEIEATVGDKELIAEAKYGEKACTAQDLAFRAMKKQAQLGSQHIQNIAKDFQASGALKVTTTPNAGAPVPKTKAADENAQIAQLAAMIASGGVIPEAKKEEQK